MTRLLATLALLLLLALCAPAAAGQGYLAVPVDDPGIEGLQQMDNFSNQTFALMGSVRQSGVDCYLLHLDYPESLSAWVRAQPYWLCERQAELPSDIQALLADPESGVRAHAWAGREP